MDDPHLPGVPIEKTLWDVCLPIDARLLSIGGNLEPVVEVLSTTEKLESQLGDLRELSATYRSASASDEERQRALYNYNSLAAQVKQQAQATQPNRGAADAEFGGALLRKPNEESQRALANQNQQTILSTVDSLSASNVTVDQNRTRVFTGSGTLSVTRAPDGFTTGGDPFQSQYSLTGTANGQVWRDNRANETPGSTSNASANVPTPQPAVNVGRDFLALNDSVAINLPAKDAQSAANAKRSEATKAESGRKPIRPRHPRIV